MANKTLFQSIVGKLFPKTDTVNHEGAPAYEFTPRHALAQYAVTGCLNRTFYADAKDQLDQVLDLATKVDGEFIARTAIYSRQRAYMKDMPALLTAILAGWDGKLLAAAFPRTIDNGRMLRNFVQIIRSGAVGRKSFGSGPKRLVQRWLEARDADALFADAIGQSPSLADVIKLVHPRPADPARKALYGYLLGREHDETLLPTKVRAYEAFRKDPKGEVPDVPFQMLTSLTLSTGSWRAIARRASWQTTRMNLNTFVRHGVFDETREGRNLETLVADRLRDPKQIRASRVFPHQLLAAWAAAGATVPASIRDALQDAMEVAVENVPKIEGQIVVCTDVSGSMSSPVTGHRKGATSAIRCVDLAALMTAAVARQNRHTLIIPFEHRVVDLTLNPRDSVLTSATRLAAVGGGGTNCSAPLALLNERKARCDLVIYVSDNESWVDPRRGRGTELMNQWGVFKQRNPAARLVCIDLAPGTTTQAIERDDVLNVGGFSDQVFEIVSRFASGELGASHWVAEIEKVQLDLN